MISPIDAFGGEGGGEHDLDRPVGRLVGWLPSLPNMDCCVIVSDVTLTRRFPLPLFDGGRSANGRC